MLKLLRRVLVLGLFVAAIYALWKKFAGPDSVGPGSVGPGDFRLPTQPAPFPPAPVVAPAPEISHPAPAASARWVDPDDGACPISHPVKGKLASGIFHVPGGQNYDRTRADRCYADGAAAEGDGLRQAKR